MFNHISKEVPKRTPSQAPRMLEVDERLLGWYDPALSVQESSTYLNAEQPGKDDNFVLQVYSGGALCSEEQSSYNFAHVKLACFLTKTSPAEIVSIRWTSKCGVLILVHTPGLCDADDRFRTRVRNRNKAQLVPLSGEFDEKESQPISCNAVIERDNQ